MDYFRRGRIFRAFAYGEPYALFLVIALIVWLIWYIFGPESFRKISQEHPYLITIAIVLASIVIALLSSQGIIPKNLWY